MKVNETQRIQFMNVYQKHHEQRVGDAGRKRQKDEVQISAEAQEMLSFSRANGENRAQLIENLKQKVESGTYHVDAGKIAEKIWPYIQSNSKL